mgnify:FL=1
MGAALLSPACSEQAAPAPPAPLPDESPAAPPAPKSQPRSKSPKEDAPGASSAEALAEVRRHIALAQAGERDGSFPLFDAKLNRPWRLRLESLDAEPLRLGPGRTAVRGRFLSLENIPVVADFLLESSAGRGPSVQRALPWRVGESLRFYYDENGSPVELDEAPAAVKPWWLRWLDAGK